MNAKERIKDYLDQMAANDPQFANEYANENKSLDECFQYILSEARKQGSSVCMTDEEVFGLAVHYYDEPEIKFKAVPENELSAVSTSDAHSEPIELTDEERKEARRIALNRLAEEQYKGMKNKPAKRSKSKTDDSQQMTLF